jgi:hypothetical protein
MRFRLPGTLPPEKHISTVAVITLRSLLLLLVLTVSAKAADNDTVVRDYDVDLTQTECRQSAMRLFQTLATDGVPVRELGHIIYYSDTASELIALCRADRGLLVLFTRGPLTVPAHIGIDRALR